MPRSPQRCQSGKRSIPGSGRFKGCVLLQANISHVFPWVSRLARHEEGGKEQQSWSRLHSQIIQKLMTLKKVQEEHQTLISSEDGGNEKVRKY